MNIKPFVLFAPADPLKADGAPVTRNGLPVQRFVKELLHTGTYKHPRDSWTLNVTTDRMDRWVAAFKAMQKNGVDVTAVKDHRRDADGVVGYVVDMYRDGDRLFGTHEIIGKDAIDLASRVGTTSVWIEPAFVDGKGVEYGESIIHNAIVQQPVVPGQQPFQAIAASLGNAAPLILENDMDFDKALTEMRSVLGCGPELTADNLAKTVHDRIAAAESGKAGADKEKQEIMAKVASLEAQLREKERKQPDDESLDAMADGLTAQFDALATSGAVLPAVAASLKGILIGDKGKRNVYAMSAAYSQRPIALAKELIEVLKTNKPAPETGIKTGPQGVKILSFGEGDENKERKQSIDEVVAVMVPARKTA